MDKKFWAVWRENGGSPPQKRHDTFIGARAEADRLARQGDARYYVLEVIGVVAPVDIPIEYNEIKSHD